MERGCIKVSTQLKERKRKAVVSDKIKAILTLVLGSISSFYNGLNVTAQVLITLVMLDFFMGLLIASIDHKIRSGTAFKGIVKKVSYLVMIYLGIGLDLILDQSIFANLIIMYLIIIEIISILEHLDSIDVKYPKFIRVMLDKLMNDIDKGQLPDNWKPDPRTLESEDD